ncbi:piggyBac transposable element-derived protein 3-like [Dermacentor albipictus]|uniref:piggyBac transposable element-derived protein 3-like n=1 Tax=Dermacentor albipictus TaxID=60249 RepID=UPI0038FC2328
MEGEGNQSSGSSDERDVLGAPAESESDSSEADLEDDSAPATASRWARKPFKVPETVFKGAAHEDLHIEGDIPSPFGYFSRYVPKSIYTVPAEKTNQYSVFQYGTFVNTDEDEISRLVALHLIMGVLKCARLRLYWKPTMRTALITSCEISCNRFEKLRNNLHIVDANKPDINDRLWKARPLLKNFQARCHDIEVEEHLCIDEQIVPFKGRLDIKQYVKGKPHPWGVKAFMLCVATTSQVPDPIPVDVWNQLGVDGSADDFVTADDDLVTCGLRTVEDIVEDVSSQPGISTSDEEDECQNGDDQPPSAAESARPQYSTACCDI